MLGISREAFRDLEWFDEEIVDTVSFNQVVTLANAIGLDLRAFFEGTALGCVTFAELAARLEALAGGDEAALADLEDAVGWELREVLRDPRTFGELPAIALADIGESVGVDWRSLLPRSAPPPSS